MGDVEGMKIDESGEGDNEGESMLEGHSKGLHENTTERM